MGEDFRYMQLDDLDENAVWITYPDGEVFDITKPVTEDLLLVQEQQPVSAPAQNSQNGISVAGAAVLAVLCVFGLFFIWMAVVALRRAAQERRGARERK